LVVLLAQLVVLRFERLDVHARRRAERHLDEVECVHRLLRLLVETHKHCEQHKARVLRSPSARRDWPPQRARRGAHLA